MSKAYLILYGRWWCHVVLYFNAKCADSLFTIAKRRCLKWAFQIPGTGIDIVDSFKVDVLKCANRLQS